jgi:hypothetical protein
MIILVGFKPRSFNGHEKEKIKKYVVEIVQDALGEMGKVSPVRVNIGALMKDEVEKGINIGIMVIAAANQGRDAKKIRIQVGTGAKKLTILSDKKVGVDVELVANSSIGFF